MTTVTFLTIIAICAIVLVLQFLFSYFSVKPIACQAIDATKYCIIDIRDFNIAHHSPVTNAQNIPLSYLSRTSKEQNICQKDIVFITDARQAAGKAARIIAKKMKKSNQNYFFVVQ